MGYPLWDMLSDLAVARGLRGAEADSDGRYLRGRIAAAAWIPGMGLALLLGGWAGSWIVGLGVLGLVLACMYLYAVRPRWVATLVRRAFAKKPS